MTGGVFCGYGFSILGLRAFAGLTVLAIAIFLLHLIAQKRFPLQLILGGVLLDLLPLSGKFNWVIARKTEEQGMNNKAVESEKPLF